MPSAHDLRVHEPTGVYPHERPRVHAELAASLVALLAAAGDDPAAVDLDDLVQLGAWAVESLPAAVVERIRRAESASPQRQRAAQVEQLAAELAAAGVEPLELDEAVHEAVSRDGSAVNNAGLEAQVAALLDGGWPVANLRAVFLPRAA